jgi:hydroxyethylthiazole kinase-like uncharacterized protein yjeF
MTGDAPPPPLPPPHTPLASLPPLPPRDRAGHKGTFGTVAVIGGCAAPLPATGGAARVMIGGPALAAAGALRAGAGLATLVMPGSILAHAITILPSATGIALPADHAGDLDASTAVAVVDELVSTVDCLVIGPGLGVSEGARALVLRAIQQEECPVVLDADGLSCLASIRSTHLDFHARAVLTPHVGEYRRLAQALGVDTPPDAGGAATLARRIGAVVVLKSATTHVSDGHETWTHTGNNPAMATGGTGDVLAGALGALIAQHSVELPLRACAAWSVHVHARAGALWRDAHAGASGGLLAIELADRLPQALHEARQAACNPAG